MEQKIQTKYEPNEIERRWDELWNANKMFRSTPDERQAYTIVIPPPNVTGVLHMGHMLNNMIQDILIRKARMEGKNACWVPGTDHASIATEAKVVAKLASEGIEKKDLTREQFLEHAWEWTHKHGGIILQQLRKLGASCDWDRTRFTLDDEMSRSVLKVFVDLFEKGLIYRGIRMVNWDPKAKTALSDEEVIYKETKGKLFYLRYKLEGSEDYLLVATTRPETIMGDVAVCVNPADERYKNMVGKKVIVPLVNRAVPVIADEYVDKEFGTGALKITPAHDVNDYAIGEKYGLEVIDIFEDDGRIAEVAKLYVGQDRFDVREQIVKDLAAANLLEKEEDYENKVGCSERTGVPIEPKLSMQWFLKMEELAKPALAAVMDGEIEIYPAKFKNTYRHWMENIRDWCISRQLWWGHRIPAWYISGGGFVVAEDENQALEKARAITKNPNLTASDLRQDEDCLDTWFSSWLWPVSVFNGILEPENPEIKYYYPTNDLVTGPDILFFWVARMIIAGYEFQRNMPFKNVYLTGIVRDKFGRKMSKQLGNSPDPLMLIDKYGADGVRMGMLLMAPAGNDLPFDETLCEQGRNFNNKIWNAFRLIKGWTVDENAAQPERCREAVLWFKEVLKKTAREVNSMIEKYRLSEALMALYKLFWDEFSAWFLEMIKPEYGKPIDAQTYAASLEFFEDLLKLLHPYMPFITEELWHQITGSEPTQSIMFTTFPKGDESDENLLREIAEIKEIVASIRAIRQGKSIPNKEKLKLVSASKIAHESLLKFLCNLDEIIINDSKIDGALQFMVGTREFFVPMEGKVDLESEIAKLKAELKYQEGFVAGIEKKLSNERFVANAPAAVVEMERKKLSDGNERITALRAQLAALEK